MAKEARAWSEILSHITTTKRPEDREYERRINDESPYSEDSVVPIRKMAFNPRKHYNEIIHLLNAISLKRNQASELQREIEHDEQQLHDLQDEWLRESHDSLKCFERLGIHPDLEVLSDTRIGIPPPIAKDETE